MESAPLQTSNTLSGFSAVCQSPQRSADRSTRRAGRWRLGRASSAPGCPRLGWGAWRHVYGGDPPSPPSHGVIPKPPIYRGVPPNPPTIAALLVVGSRPLRSVPEAVHQPPRLPPRSSRELHPARCPVPRPTADPLRSCPPSVHARHYTMGRALPCQGQALRCAPGGAQTPRAPALTPAPPIVFHAATGGSAEQN